MKRKIYNKLKKWKQKDNRKPLLLLGARQVGKTWIMKEFGRAEYKQVAYVNCDDDPRVKTLFETDYNIERITLTLQAITGIPIEENDTLIVFDEIQEAPRGLHSLKYFCENAPKLHVMAAGSLLGITLGQNTSFPVGKVDMLNLYPMDFEEFLEALGQDAWIKLLHTKDWTLIEGMKTKLIEFLRLYYFVGGMPEAVAHFIKKRDLAEVRNIQSQILAAYRNDISKHASARESIRIGQIFNSLPSQLAKENKKFIYGLIKEGARAADYELAIQWLMDAGIVYKATRIRSPRMPLKFYEDPGAFKLFPLDCGLFACMADTSAEQILVNPDVFVEFKGALTEVFVMQQLKAADMTPFYWSNDKTPAEIDFVLQYDNRTLPIEVKAAENVRSRSLQQFIKDNPELKGLRISMRGYVDQEWMENVPLYAFGVYFK
ncbi:MAG: ATP-binding protein [Bacteroidales bacterium]|nr:ATP-binding protein [Bacteroidales bacterium]